VELDVELLMKISNILAEWTKGEFEMSGNF